MGSEVKEWGVRVQRKKGSLRQSLVGTTAHFNAWRSLASKVRLRFVAGKRFCSYLTPLIRFPLRWPIQPAHGPAVSTGRQLKRQRPRASCCFLILPPGLSRLLKFASFPQEPTGPSRCCELSGLARMKIGNPTRPAVYVCLVRSPSAARTTLIRL